MNSFFQYFFISFYVLLVFSGQAFAGRMVLPEAKIAVYFSQGGGAKQAILEAIGNAKETIHVHSFFLSDREIANALIEARHRGVSVDAVLCRRGQTEALDPQGRFLVEAGIPVMLNPLYRAEHNKVMIFDRKTVQTGSYNYRFDADLLDAENVIFIEAPLLAEVYLEDYYARRNESRPYDLTGPFKERDEFTQPTDGGPGKGRHMTLYALPVETAFVPGNGKEAILRHMREAEQSIILHTYYLSDPDFADALIAAKKRGVHVEAVLSAKAPEKDAHPFLASVLAEEGIPVLLDPEHRNAHNKVIIYDGKIIQTGSYNLKKDVDKINAENVLFIHSAKLAHVYLQNYEKHKSHSKPLE